MQTWNAFESLDWIPCMKSVLRDASTDFIVVLQMIDISHKQQFKCKNIEFNIRL